MEQRIGSKSQPLDAAAVDPAYIPGLTSPVPAQSAADAADKDAEVEDSAVEDADAAETAEAEEVTSEEAVSEEAEEVEDSDDEVGDQDDGDDEDETEASEEAGADVDGPVFEASDRRASIKADHSGVQLRLDDQQAEFRWEEIGAVETESPRFGKRFTITVHTPDRRWYPIEIEAPARARFKDWEDQLDAVLDAYFEDGDDGDDSEDVEESVDVEESAP
ncbi:hypothetical protein ACFYPC_01395 [Streptomyces sp. NPDC005808]|uniref:hypothetical protein n=1 Tax=Streptomyces sp. NPDC005808 TaxID=3364734 RepID=UPI00368951D0